MQIDKVEGADFISDNSCFNVLSQKYPNKTCLVPYLRIFVFSRKFATRQLGFDSLLVKNTQIRHFSPPHLAIFVSSQNFTVTLIWRCWFEIWAELFKVRAQKYPNKALFVINLSIFIISDYLAVRQSQGWLFQIWQ